MILVTGTVDVDPSQRDAFVDASNEFVATTRQEVGCEHYVISADIADSSRFYINERWTTEADMLTHAKAPHLVAFMGASETMVRHASVTRWDGATASTIR